MDKYYDLEQVYDDEIGPLMDQVIKICEKHGMPMLATFAYRRAEDGDDYCTSSIDSLNRAPISMRMACQFMIRDGITTK